MISLDTETALIEPGLLAPPLVCVSWYEPTSTYGGLYPHHQAKPHVKAWLQREPLIIGLNIAYDMGVICAEWPGMVPLVFDAYREGRIQDVGLNQMLIDIAHGRFQHLDKVKGSYSLKGLCKRILGEDLEKEGTPRLTYGRLRDQPLSAYTPEEVEYAVKDAIKPAEIYERQLEAQAEWAKDNPGPPLLDCAPQRAYAAFALHLASCWGVRSNKARCDALLAEQDRIISEAGELLRSTRATYEVTKTRQRKGLKCKETKLETGPLLSPAGKRNTKAAKSYMVSIKGSPEACAKTESGAIALDQEACEATGDPVLLAYTIYARADTLRSRVQDLAWGAIRPLQPRYGALKDTGRTSASKGSGPTYGFQIQNMPKLKGSRETLEPRPGCIFFGADFGAAELHTLAQQLLDIFGHSILADTLNAGLDVYKDFATALYQVPYDEVTKDQRQSAKPGPLGIPGGMGAATFQSYSAGYGVYLTEDESRRQIQIFKHKYEDIAEYLRQIGKAIDRGLNTVCFPRTGFWRGGLTYSSMANSYFQHYCAAGALAALCEVQRRCYSVPDSALYGCRIWGFVHDEILGEAPYERAPEAAEELAEVMRQEFNRFTPDVPTDADPAIFWRWSKGTDPKRDENGRLTPSDPENRPLTF